ncbi:dihydroxyacetone kinase phosphoryl donor subunit DhaM [Agrococcus sp. Marseille-Q4369]|uniref:dihydroxyacetone kinase phosphoryl donor subunit DhaM n=1 Tax=Agrococcus sp. Marseille-Q4369 TaxID=2810513 RepID=UPI001B8B6A91|nr:dihydroxyacetone kinase phosphoryl donor subunit DhaM [Agrococcus sp. Marseille-Q4369]QUW19317.1 PTS-dependent dihydroxyacetone kinase phosphotransferase subunit DhaM [Agrococcus sp. Marseille-Q4369]
MTVGLVIVSHSARIAEGVVELAAQMAPSVVLAAAGGTDDGALGTSFDRVQAAIGEADSGDGVVVLCDLGSAVLTAQTALDFADAPERIRIADAPLVEGAVAAAVAAEGGAGLDQVVTAAESGPQSGARSEPTGAQAAGGGAVVAPEDGAAVLELELANEHGLHARPASLLVRTASGFDAEVTVNGVDASSLLRVLALGLDRGAIARFEATGPQANEAIAAIRELADGGFGEG